MPLISPLMPVPSTCMLTQSDNYKIDQVLIIHLNADYASVI